MKTQLIVYVHATNGMSIQLIPETEFEAAFLRAFADSDAKFEGSGHPCEAKFGEVGYRIKVERGDTK